MPANLPPQYVVAGKRLRAARDLEEKIAVLGEMWSLLPKHKGTVKVQAVRGDSVMISGNRCEIGSSDPGRRGRLLPLPRRGMLVGQSAVRRAKEGTMKALIAAAALCAGGCMLVPGGLGAAEETDPGRIVANPGSFINRNVTITVGFGKISNVFHGWEGEANLNRKIKFLVQPLGRIACYADQTRENEKLLGNLSPGQELTITGNVRKYKFEAKIKGERRTVKRTVKGSEIYGFIVRKIDRVGAAPGGSGLPGLLQEMMEP
ncbi:MAG: hypothetical protein PHN82_01950 [bacterium]|nr:hypothetical protein [bacterium]